MIASNKLRVEDAIKWGVGAIVVGACSHLYRTSLKSEAGEVELAYQYTRPGAIHVSLTKHYVQALNKFPHNYSYLDSRSCVNYFF